MKVAIVAFNNLKYSPYVKIYSDKLDDAKVEYDIIYPNRDGIEDNETNHVAVSWDPAKNKLLNFLHFRSKAISVLKKNKYDFVFVLTTFPAVLLSGVLKRRYNGRYLVDIRDYTYEHNAIYYALEKKALKNSKMNVISSPGFKRFLPEGEYFLCHNMSSAYTEPKASFNRQDGRIVIGYVGTIAYARACKNLISLVLGDDRFCLHFYGNEREPAPVNSYVNELNCDRIKCFGAYNPSEKDGILESVDLLFNCYGNNSLLVKCAISNKLYDSFYFKKPLITNSDTIMSDLAGDFSFDIDKCGGNLDGLYSWYQGIDEDEMVKYMNDRLGEYFDDRKRFNDAINHIIENL